MSQEIVIDPRFRGSPDSGHFGYLSGRVAAYFDGPAELTLNRSIPLGRRIDLEWYEDVVLLCDGDHLVATAEPKAFDVPPSLAPSYQEAVKAARRAADANRHPNPSCFVCGPQRRAGDGLRIFPGPVEGADLVAAPWVPDASLANGDGLVRAHFVHAALDCPGAVAARQGRGAKPLAPARMVARIEGPVRAGDQYVVAGWRTGGSKRRHHVGAALFTPDGVRRAVAQATWIEAL